MLYRTQTLKLHADRINQQKYAFMYSKYEARYFYFELVFVSRRTLFVLIGLLSQYPPIQAVLAHIVVGLAWGLQLKFQPYAEDRLDSLDNFGLVPAAIRFPDPRAQPLRMEYM